MSDEKTSKLASALARVNTTTPSPGGLKGALMRKESSALAPPKTANISAIQTAINKSASTALAIQHDEAKFRAAYLKGMCFVIDATGSRLHSWLEAQKIQAKMFDALQTVDNLKLGIVCHLGGQVKPLGWFNNAGQAKDKMAAVQCVGGHTQICPALTTALAGEGGYPPSSIIMVGDAFEENLDALRDTCKALSQKKIKVYAFLEGNCATAENAYKLAAELTGGVFKKFGEDLSLSDLCVAAAVQDLGGKVAFDRLLAANHKGALALQGGTYRALLGNNAKPK